MKLVEAIFIGIFSLLSGFLGQSIAMYFTTDGVHQFITGIICLTITFIGMSMLTKYWK